MENHVGKMICLKCSLIFDDQNLYEKHIKSHDNKIKRKSNEIDKTIKKLKISTETLQESGSTIISHYCEFCDESLFDKSSYDRHCSTVIHKIKELNFYNLNYESMSKLLLKYLNYTIMIINFYFTLAINDIFSIHLKKDKTGIDDPIKESKISTKSLQESFSICSPYYCNFCDKSWLEKKSFESHCITVNHKIKELNFYNLNNESECNIENVTSVFDINTELIRKCLFIFFRSLI
jgi:hypothetical protein